MLVRGALGSVCGACAHQAGRRSRTVPQRAASWRSPSHAQSQPTASSWAASAPPARARSWWRPRRWRAWCCVRLEGGFVFGITTREVRESAETKSTKCRYFWRPSTPARPGYPPSVEFSSASHELRELIQSLLQQLRAEYEAAAALCPGPRWLRGAARSVDRTLTMRLHVLRVDYM